jgi:hypothetical protein
MPKIIVDNMTKDSETTLQILDHGGVVVQPTIKFQNNTKVEKSMNQNQLTKIQVFRTTHIQTSVLYTNKKEKKTSSYEEGPTTSSSSSSKGSISGPRGLEGRMGVSRCPCGLTFGASGINSQPVSTTSSIAAASRLKWSNTTVAGSMSLRSW